MRFNYRKLKQILDDRSIKQKELAEAADVTEAFVSGWCKGTKVPSLETAGRIAKFLGISIDDLVEDREGI